MPSEDICLKEMINVGVTAKLTSPNCSISHNFQSSSTDTETTQLHSKYRAFLNEKSSSPSNRISQAAASDDSRNLYQLKTIDERGFQKTTPSKIEFSLYRKSQRRAQPRLPSNKTVKSKKSHSSLKRLIESESKSEDLRPPCPAESSLVEKLKKSVKNLKKNQTKTDNKNSPVGEFQKLNGSVYIYPFDHGCAEYFRTTDCAPQIISELLAQRATDYATRFWAEFFGSLHIGVAFILTFFIQTYRFVLYSVVKSVIVGFLQMTSDYGIKPLLTVIFNGFLQPVLIFVHNILSSVRDVLLPVSETMGSFLKPIGGMLRSIRLATVKVNSEKGAIKGV